jgi:hypothetical protein
MMRTYCLLFPCSPLDGINKVDEDFRKESEDATNVGFKIAFFDHDALMSNGAINIGPIPDGHIVILRSWMLSLDHYQKLYAAITGRGLSMFTSPSEYERKHY